MNFIEDGTGGGNRAKVTQDNRLRVASLTKTEDRVINEDEGRVWSVNFEDIDPAGANDYFVYIKNTGTKRLSITDIRIASTVAGRGQVRFVTGTASGGSDITPVSRNSSKNVTPQATLESGTDITGLTNAGTLFYLHLDTVDQLHHLRTTASIAIEAGGAVALFWEAATGVLTGTISLVEASAADVE